MNCNLYSGLQVELKFVFHFSHSLNLHNSISRQAAEPNFSFSTIENIETDFS